jgi:hypothetical protein
LIKVSASNAVYVIYSALKDAFKKVKRDTLRLIFITVKDAASVIGSVGPLQLKWLRRRNNGY